MFYGTCKHACPVLIASAKQVESAASPSARARTRIVMVTIDPARDTPAALAELARSYDVGDRWTFLHGSDGDIRELAAVLGIRYRATADGEFQHSNVLTLLNAQGAVVHQTVGLGASTDEMVAELERLAVSP